MIRGGLRSDADLEAARAADPILAQHFSDVGFLHEGYISQDRLFYASYRLDHWIVWTRARIRVHAVEAVLEDR